MKDGVMWDGVLGAREDHIIIHDYMWISKAIRWHSCQHIYITVMYMIISFRSSKLGSLFKYVYHGDFKWCSGNDTMSCGGEGNDNK